MVGEIQCVLCASCVCVCIRYQHLIYTAFADRMNEFQSTQKREHVFYFHVMLNDFYKKGRKELRRVINKKKDFF